MKTMSSKTFTARRAEGGFTLVELLMVIAIITVLSTLAVGVIGSASNDAKAAATRARVGMIERIFETQMEEYEVRRLPFRRNIAALTQTIITNGTWSGDGLVHFRNLNRMFTVDLIRSEIPNGRQDNLGAGIYPARLTPGLGNFPTPAFYDFLTNELGVPVSDPNLIAIESYRLSGGIARWSGWALDFGGPTSTTGSGRDQEQRFADAAELLHRYLSQIDYNGTSALDALGSSAVGDTDGDEQLEVVDAWGEPIYFQFLQPNVERVDATLANSAVWALVAGLDNMTEVEIDTRSSAADYTAASRASIKPIRVDQLRPFVSSSRLLEIDGTPPDVVLLNPQP